MKKEFDSVNQNNMQYVFSCIYINKYKNMFFILFCANKMRDDQSKWLSIEVVIDAEQTSTIRL